MYLSSLATNSSVESVLQVKIALVRMTLLSIKLIPLQKIKINLNPRTIPRGRLEAKLTLHVAFSSVVIV